MTDISSLIERCRQANGPDRNLDAMIHHWTLDGVGTGYYADAPRYTASIDIAIALVAKHLPGWGVEIGIPARRGGIGNARLYPGDERNWELTFFGSGETPSLAVLQTLLSALSALSIQETKNAE